MYQVKNTKVVLNKTSLINTTNPILTSYIKKKPNMDLFTSTPILTWLSIALLFALSAYIHRRRSTKKHPNLPPGPKPWPVIGNLNLIGSLPHQSLHQLSLRYGPLMHLRFGSFSVAVASSVDMAKAFLKTHDLTFSGRPKFAAGRYTTYNYSDITWSDYGPYWRQARKMCLMELFSAKRLESYEYIRKEEMKSMLHGLYKSCENEVFIKDQLSTLSLNVISRMVLGKKYTDESEKAIVSPEEFKVMLDELFLLSGVLNIGDSIPWLEFLDLQGYIKRMKKLSKKFDKFLEHVLSEHDERRQQQQSANKSFIANDMVDVLLEFADNPDLDVKLERHGVKAFTQVSIKSHIASFKDKTDSNIFTITNLFLFYFINTGFDRRRDRELSSDSRMGNVRASKKATNIKKSNRRVRQSHHKQKMGRRKRHTELTLYPSNS